VGVTQKSVENLIIVAEEVPMEKCKNSVPPSTVVVGVPHCLIKILNFCSTSQCKYLCI